MVQNVAPLVAELEPEDFYLLSGVEHGMRFSKWVNREKLPGFSGLTPEEVDYRLDRCEDREFLERRTLQYQGFRLTFEGYDALALHTFAERDTVAGVGAPLGVGKESDVYEAQAGPGVGTQTDPDVTADEDAEQARIAEGDPVALKFHREGYTNFREVHRERDYASEKAHVSWMYTARKAAEREHEALTTLAGAVSVPAPVDQNRHAIVMEKIAGVELGRTRLDDDQVVGVLDLVLEEIAAAYEAGFVHADVSEYNVFVSERGVTLFDWPQAVPTDHENAREFLERDVRNVVAYFRRKYPSVTPDVEVEAVAESVAADEFESVTG